MPEALELYHARASPNSRRVRIFLAEKGLALTLVPVDLGEGEQRSDAYRQINPRQMVPTSCWKMARRLARSRPSGAISRRPIRPSRFWALPREKALVTMWERRVELEGFAAVMEGVRNAAPGLKGRAIAGPHDYEQIPAIVDRSRLRVANFLVDLDTRLTDAPFVAGDRFSVADITALATIDFAMKAFAISIPEEHRALTRWYKAVSARPSTNA
jgi:glutathione S-transferase